MASKNSNFLETLEAANREISSILDLAEDERQHITDRLEMAKTKKGKAENARLEAEKRGDYDAVETALQNIRVHEDQITYYEDRLASLENEPLIDFDRYERIVNFVNDAYQANEKVHIQDVIKMLDKIKEYSLIETDNGNKANELFSRLDREIMRKDNADPRTKWTKVNGLFMVPWFIKDITDPENGRAGHYYNQLRNIVDGTEAKE